MRSATGCATATDLNYIMSASTDLLFESADLSRHSHTSLKHIYIVYINVYIIEIQIINELLSELFCELKAPK